MPSVPRSNTWMRFPHSWEEDAFGYSSGIRHTSGRDDLLRTEGHDYRNLSSRGPDKGGNFQVKRHEYSEKSNYAVGSDAFNVLTYPKITGSFGTWYRGPLLAAAHPVSPGDGIWPVLSSSTDLEMSAMGTTAIARTIPTNPVVDLTVFMGELVREKLPRLAIDTLKRRTRRAKSAGGDYLNYEFGWKPLVRDLQDFAKAVTKQESILQQYERNSGKAIKRKRVIEDSVEVSSETWSTRPVPMMYHWIHTYIEPGVMTKTTTIKVRRWFSGVFTYYLPPQSGNNIGSARANKLFGTRLTPSDVWNLTPWSWAIDWVSNAGDVLHNVSAFANDGLVMPYAYVMEEKSVTHKYELRGVTVPRIVDASPGPYNFEQSFTTIVKKRLKATPFGFGLDTGGFTLRQQAIIAALGLTRT